MANRAFSFKAKTVEAYTIKSLSEVLQNILTDVCFTFKKDGIELLTIDNKKPPHLLVNLKLDSEAFDEYYCPKDLNVGINLQHLYKMLKSIKKKDSITLFINKHEPSELKITTVQSDTNQPVTSGVKIQKLSEIKTDVPEGYDHPIHIPTNTYQKMCKDMQGISNKIQVYSKGAFLRFSCQIPGMYGKQVPFGELDEDSSEDEYDDIFHTKSLGQLIKISGLNNQMQIYTPPGNMSLELPLKLGVPAGQLGRLDIYIKSVAQIEEVESGSY